MFVLLITTALAGDDSHTSTIDLFEADTSPDKPDWGAARKGPVTRPYIPWTIDAQQGDGTVKFGDVRFRDEVVTGIEEVDVVMTIRVNGIDDYMWPYWQEKQQPGLWLASTPKDSSYISSDPSTRIWQDEPGFYIWDHEITNLTVTGLPYSSETRIEVVWLAVSGIHDSMASHGLTNCVGTNIDVHRFSMNCGGTDLKLKIVGWQLVQAFPSAPKVAKTLPREASPLDDLPSLFAPK